MGNNKIYTFQRISTPTSAPDSLKAFTRKVNDALETLTSKLYGYIEYKDIASQSKTLIIDATLNAAQYVKDLAAKVGIGDVDHIGPTTPSSPATGDIWCDTSATPSVFKKWDGSIWAVVTGSETLMNVLAQVPYSTLTNGDLRTLLENVSHNANGILLTGLGGTLQLLLGPSRISFLDSGEEVAYITGNKLYITSGEFVSELKIGNYFLSPDASGGMVIK